MPLLSQRLPKRSAAIEGERLTRIGAGQAIDDRRQEAGAAGEVFKRAKWPGLARGFNPHGGGLWQADDHAQAETNGGRMSGTCRVGQAARPRRPTIYATLFERRVPAAVVDIDGTHFDAVLLGVADELSWSVEAHWLAIEQSGAEVGRVVA